MKATNNPYRQILKATTLFGGVEAFNIIVSIAKSKIAALLIGVSGIGVLGVLNSTLHLILSLTRLGLDFSLVNEIASVNSNPNKEKLSRIVNISSRITWFTGVFGAVIILICSPWLSLIAFGDETHTLSFIIISIAVFFNQLAVGNIAILQGLKSLKKLAKTTLITSFFSLLSALGFYYYFGIQGIPYVIAASSIIGFIIAKFFVDQIKIPKVNVSVKEVVKEGKGMLQLGFVLSIGGLAGVFTAYLVQIYITNVGGINEVGLYNAGFVIIHSYVAVFFSSLNKDFFPRLSEVTNDNVLMNKIVNQQILVSVLLLTPFIVIFIPFAPVITSILYTSDFLPIISMLIFGIVGTLFKAVSWSMGFIIVAKGDSKLYLKTEIISNIIMLLLIMTGYHYHGLMGIGLSFALYYAIYMILIKIIVSKKYQFQFSSRFNKLFYICIIQSIVMLCLTFIQNDILKYSGMVILGVFSVIFTFIQMNKYMDLSDLIKNKFKK